MRIFVFSDIHGNSNVLSDLCAAWDVFKPDLKIFLGDIYGYYYGQEEIIDFFRANDVKCLLGNHDKMALDLLENKYKLEDVSKKYGESYKQILKASNENITWLRSLSPCYQINLGIYTCLFVHGDHIDNLNGRIYPDTPVNINCESWDTMFSGHTHIPFVRKIGNRLIINVGSIGQPRNGDLASAVLFNSDSGSFEFLNFKWYPELVLKELELHGDSDLPHTAILNRKRF